MVGGVADERREKGGGVEEEKGLGEGGGGVGFWMGGEVKRVEAWEGEDGFLKTLGLKNVIGLHNIIIESSSWDSFRVECSSFFQLQLFHLKISSEKHDDINIIWDIDEYLPLMENSLEISAPNLKYLEWDGGMMNHQHLAKLKFNVVTHLHHYLNNISYSIP
ncbi:hypothetical protein ACFXTO_014302 [Malus domestica]